jgi:acyl-coenzyme A thioesterase PaaI-like protein
MKGKIMSVKTALKLYQQNPGLPHTFSEQFSKHLVAQDKFENIPEKAAFKMLFPKQHGNIQATVHGGALSTLIDVATTIAIVRMTPLRTLSISIST